MKDCRIGNAGSELNDLVRKGKIQGFRPEHVGQNLLIWFSSALESLGGPQGPQQSYILRGSKYPHGGGP